MSSRAIGSGGIGYVSEFPAPGLPKAKRLVTGFNEEGKGVFLPEDGPYSNVDGDHFRVMGDGQALANILYWTKETPVNLNTDADLKNAHEKEPGLHAQNGTVVRMIDFGPGLESPMHRAMSIDYGIVLQGEFVITLDSGESRVMKQGDVSIQRATAHKWKNITENCTKPGRMLYILLDIQELTVNGQKIEGFLGQLEQEYADLGH